MIYMILFEYSSIEEKLHRFQLSWQSLENSFWECFIWSLLLSDPESIDAISKRYWNQNRLASSWSYRELL